MTEEQAERMIELLQDIKDELSNVQSAIMLWSDAGDVVKAIEALREDLAERDG